MHNIMVQNNKRLVSSIKRQKVQVVNDFDSTKSSSLQGRSKESQHKFNMSISNEARQILQTIASIQQDLQMRVNVYGNDSLSTIECLEHFAKTCNDHALHLISLGQFRPATEILHQCEKQLLAPIGANFPILKFQTLNNLAHAHNVQANVRLSLKYLLKGLEYAHQIQDIELIAITKGKPNIPIVETYVNICNAYTFLHQIDQAIQFAEEAINLSQKIINSIMVYLENPELSQDDRDFYAKQYHSLINLHVMCFHTKGQVLEKNKLFEDAIREYQAGKHIVEANYGTTHKMYIDLVNSINGAKLRTKYLMHSNIPDQQQPNLQIFKSNSQAHSFEDDIAQEYTKSKGNKNLFLKEQERLKPQNQKKKARLRPSSAKTNSSTQSKKEKNPRNNFQNFTSDTLQHNASHSQFDVRNSSWYPHKTNINKQLKQSISRIPWGNNVGSLTRLESPTGYHLNPRVINQKVTQKDTIIRNGRLIRNREAAHSHRRQESIECGHCTDQLEQIKTLQVEQQKLMSLMMQQSITHQQNLNQTQTSNTLYQTYLSQTANAQQAATQFSPPAPQPVIVQFQQAPPQQQFYYPPQMPQYPQPPMQQQYPPQPYYGGMPMGPYLPPPPYQYPPMNNNYFNMSQSQSAGKASPDKDIHDPLSHYRPLYREDIRQSHQEINSTNINIPQQQHNYRNQNTDDKKSHHSSTYTDLNERDSKFEDDQSINNTRYIQRKNEVVVKVVKVVEQEKVKVVEQKKVINGFYQEKEPQKPIIKIQKTSLKEINLAAIKIQRQYRRHSCQEKLKIMKARKTDKYQFHRQMYSLKSKNNLKLNLIVSLITKNSTKKERSIRFEIYNQQTKMQIFEIEHPLSLFGFKDNEWTKNVEIQNKIKAIISQIQFQGIPKEDFTQQLQVICKKTINVKEIHTQLTIIESVYSQPQKQVSLIQQEPKQQAFPKLKAPSSNKSSSDEEQIDEDFEEEYLEDSIHDDHSDSHSKVSFSEKKTALRRKSSSSQSEEEVKVEEQKFVIPQIVIIEEKIQHKETLVFHMHEEKKDNKIFHNQEAHHTQNKEDFNFQFKGFKDQKQVRKAGYDITKNEYHKILTTHKEQAETVHRHKTLKYKKQKSKSSKKSSDSEEHYDDEDSFKEEEIEDINDDVASMKSEVISVKSEVRDKKKDKKDKKKKKSKKEEENEAAVLIQTKVRAHLVQKDKLETKGKGKNKICQYLIQSENNAASVKLTEKFNKKKNTQKFKLVVKNLNKEYKKDSHKIELKGLAVEKDLMQQYLKLCLIIVWKSSKIEKVSIEDKNFNPSKLHVELTLNMHVNVDQQIVAPPPFIEPTKEKIEIPAAISPLKSLSNSSSEKDLKSELPSAFNNAATVKKFFDEVKRKQDEKISKVQAMVKGYLVKRQNQPKIDSDYRILTRISKRQGDGKLYQLALQGKKLELLQSSSDPFYIVTLREVGNIGEIFDLEISLDMAKKIFYRKDISNAELQRLIMYETNYNEFQLMIACLDVVGQEEFTLDFKKFKQLLAEEKNIVMNEPDYPEFGKFNQHSEKPKESLQQSRPSQSIHSPSSSENEEVIDTKEQKKKVKVEIKEEVLIKTAVKSPFLHPKYRAIVKIQAHIRRFLAMRQTQYALNPNFKNKSKDNMKHLKLMEKGVLKLCDIHFMYFLYTDEYQKSVKFTLKTIKMKDTTTVINLKVINLEDFGDQEAEISDIPAYIQDNLKESAEEILLDPVTGELSKDWFVNLHDFIDNNL